MSSARKRKTTPMRPSSSVRTEITAPVYPARHRGRMGKHDAGRRCGLLREAPRFRYLWLSRTISSTGIGMSRVALVLLASPHGPATVSAVLLASTLPQLLGPVAGAVADRVDQRRLLAGCEAGQGVLYAVIAVARPPVPVLLPLVAVAGLLATLFSPAGKSSVPRLVPADRLPRANALLGMAPNLQSVWLRSQACTSRPPARRVAHSA